MLIGFNAPDFTAPAILPNGELIDHFCLSENTLSNSFSNQPKKLILLLFFPYLFYAKSHQMLIDFNQRFTAISNQAIDSIAISVDSQYCQKIALETAQLDNKVSGLKGLNFPLVSDFDKSISQSYQILHPEKSVAMPSVFLIDSDFIVRYQASSDLDFTIGSNDLMVSIASFLDS